ncbi:MAG: hypothetical protein P8I38_05335 [Arenicella sp.]|jgi:Tol biopolymer transport system component|nr:hypothetical protein [Arenicella sp.]
MKNVLLTIAFSVFLASTSYAEEESTKENREPANFPETEIFLFDIDLSLKESIVSNGVNASNREGYDNQPYFTKGSDSFVYSRDDGYQTDVYEYIVESGETKRLTNSEATEFSPTPFPDNKSIAFVTSRSNSIWYGSRKDIDSPKPAEALKQIQEPIGYFAWNHKTGDLLYWSQYGFSVTLANEDGETYHFVSGHAVPSTPHVIPGTDKFSFVHRQTNGGVLIKEFDPSTKSIRPLTSLVGSNANYTWTQDGSILLIEGDVLYRQFAPLSGSWIAVADLSEFGVRGANRIAISPNGKKLAVVGLSVPDSSASE